MPQYIIPCEPLICLGGSVIVLCPQFSGKDPERRLGETHNGHLRTCSEEKDPGKER